MPFTLLFTHLKSNEKKSLKKKEKSLEANVESQSEKVKKTERLISRFYDAIKVEHLPVEIQILFNFFFFAIGCTPATADGENSRLCHVYIC